MKEKLTKVNWAGQLADVVEETSSKIKIRFSNAAGICELWLDRSAALYHVPYISATFIGVQPFPGDMARVALFNLNGPIPGHGVGSTVTQHTVEDAGYRLPEAELLKAQAALLNHMAQRRQIHAKEAA